MRLRITPLTEQEISAARAFNVRIAAKAPFFLPESVVGRRPDSSLAAPAISWTQFKQLMGTFLWWDYVFDEPASKIWTESEPTGPPITIIIHHSNM